MSFGTDVYEKKIRLQASQVRDFVAAATKCDFDVDIFYNRYAVDAKSILGVLALDLTKTLTVRMYGYNEEFDLFLSGLSIAC